jgi:hypothetical protein
MTENIKKPQLRALQYWLVDGVGELSVGFILLLVAMIYYFQEAAPGSLLSRILSIAAVVLVCGAGFGGRWMIQRIKGRTTYPRTGFVAYKSAWKDKSDVLIAIGVMALLLAFIVFTTLTDSQLADWAPLVCGLFMGIIMARAGYRSALPRLYILAFLSLLIGAGLVFSGLNIALSLPHFFGLNGLILLASGGLTLWKNLRRNPSFPEMTDEP